MNLKIFGSKSIKTTSDLKKVSIPTSSAPEQDWTLGEQDALRVPILGSRLPQDAESDSYKPDLLNPFGVCITEEAKNDSHQLSVIETLTETESLPVLEEHFVEDSSEVDNICDQVIESIIESPEENQAPEICKETVIGVYASSELYVKSLEKELAAYSKGKVHGFKADMVETQLKRLYDINLWIVNLSDDDESDTLDSVLELSTDHPTLYLSGSLSKHCKQRIETFLAEH